MPTFALQNLQDLFNDIKSRRKDEAKILLVEM